MAGAPLVLLYLGVWALWIEPSWLVVRRETIGAPVVSSRHGDRYARGLIVEEGRRLFVTSGLGTSILPVRFRVPPEVILLRLVSSSARKTP